ncbi:hypothetical protein HMPREF2976_01515 [Corynebacterium sp. HMSC077D10]|uniref:hypothetical protein n=1 Tax=unclassified Corynebacterium TaxID=2624378 RepID=UPI0008A2C779|nr:MULTISPECIES: hypothetical protein [unclassified Corynebacterium]OFN40250.1 hypothetical protein HMPREF2559_04535 [Corynebacterium sp. HMSC072G08]OFP70337.1 hypothetical protein HMPREF2976_01515 [Corynebacterium sp. HMSC077D10]
MTNTTARREVSSPIILVSDAAAFPALNSETVNAMMEELGAATIVTLDSLDGDTICDLPNGNFIRDAVLIGYLAGIKAKSTDRA